MPAVLIGALVIAVLLFSRRANAMDTLPDGTLPATPAREFSASERAAWARDLKGRLMRQGLPASGASLAVAHAALESGWGWMSRNARNGSYNLWNLTAGTSWKGATFKGPDKDGSGANITQTWRRYASLDDAVTDYLAFMSSLYPVAHSQLRTRAPNVDMFVRGLVNYGRKYFEANAATYTRDMTSIYARVERETNVSNS